MSNPPSIPLEVVSDLENRFNYHSPTEAAVSAHRAVREACHLAANTIVSVVPPGRERALALTHLEEAMFWGNAGIARNHDKLPEQSGS